ncbi:MAG: electron transfer flavoprotein subunit beta/FixA family protein [Deltaproteobacteria bacterium]|nr:electron transfer flavoprotein subunit beta/FixA family protein [Deltaproteobacteria bacterium]
MRFVVCVKEVLDPDAVNSFAVAGRLRIGDDGRSFSQTAIPRLMNGFDEQALEAALRLRDAGAPATIAVVSIGTDPANILRHAAALGADEIAHVDADPAGLDAHGTTALLTAWIRKSGPADLVLCGRQASDDDQGVVPALVAEQLGMPLVTIAREVMLEAGALRVTRVTPDGDEIVETSLPAVVTVSSEIGIPRYPTAARKIQARRAKPDVVTLEALGIAPADLAPRALLVRQLVPELHGHCELIDGSPSESARALVSRLAAEGAI